MLRTWAREWAHDEREFESVRLAVCEREYLDVTVSVSVSDRVSVGMGVSVRE